MTTYLRQILGHFSQNTSGKNSARAGANFAWLLIERIFRLSLSLTALALVARYLGPASFGVLNYSVGVVLTFAAFATLGLDVLVVRELVRAPEQAPEILGTACVLRFGCGVAALILLGAGALLWPQRLSPPAILLPIGLLLLTQPLEVTEFWFQRHLQSRRTVISRMIALTVGATVKMALVLADASLTWFAWSLALDYALYAGALVVMYARGGGRPGGWRFSRERAWAFLQYGWPLALVTLFGAVNYRLEQYLAAQAIGGAAAGCYFAALRVSEFWLPIGQALAITMLPLMGERREQAPAEFARSAQSAFDLLAALGFMVALAVTLVAPWLVAAVFGPTYQAATGVLIVKAWTAPLYFTGSARANCLTLSDAMKTQGGLALAGLAANLLLSWWLVPAAGILGLAFATLGAALVSGPVLTSLLPAARSVGREHWMSLFVWLRPRQVLAAARELL